MNKFGISLVFALAFGLAFTVSAQQGGKGKQKAAPKTFVSAQEVAALMAKAKNERKADQANLIQNLLSLAPYSANLEYRAAVGPASVHETEAELFYVIDGSGTLVTGGKLTEERRTNAQNLSGAGIEGGTSQEVAKGDFLIVPEKTPHWFSKINGTLVLMSLHVPRTQ
jgi:mannose-6-phosphate isomerase-like protein (cupin superfamily)